MATNLGFGDGATDAFNIDFELQYSGADLEDDGTPPVNFDADDFADGSNNSCTVGTAGDDLGVISCVAPANADEWRIVATATGPDTDADTDTNRDVLVYDATVSGRLVNPPMILLADGAGDVEIELNDLDVKASAVLEAGSADYVVDLGNAPFSYKFVNNSIEWVAYNKGGTRLPTTSTSYTPNQSLTELGTVSEDGIVVAAGHVTIPGIEVVAVPDEGTLGLDLINPMRLSARATGNSTEEVTANDTDNDADFSGLLGGKYTISVAGTTSSLPRDEEEMRGVVYASNRYPIGTVPLADIASSAEVRREFDDENGGTIVSSATVLQDIEYRGTIEGYVFNNLDDNDVINTTDERLINVMVVAELDNCVAPGGRRRVVHGADTTMTDEDGKYEFVGWEASSHLANRQPYGCYSIRPVGLATMPKHRAGFQPGAFDGTNLPIYDFPGDVISLNLNDTTENEAAGNKFELTLGATTTDADFEAIYDGGTIDVRVSDSDDGSGVVIQVTLVECQPPNEAVGGPTTGSTTSVGKNLTGTPLQPCGGSHGGRETQTTNESGRTSWTDLDEGWYRISTDDRNTAGTQTYQEGSEVLRIHQPNQNPVTVTVNLDLNQTGG